MPLTFSVTFHNVFEDSEAHSHMAWMRSGAHVKRPHVQEGARTINIFLFLLNLGVSVHDLVYSRLLVTTAGDNVLVVVGDVAAEHAGSLLGNEDGGAIGRSPGVEQVVFAGGDEPLATVGKLEGEDAALMEVELVLVRFVAVEHFHV